LPCPAAEPHRLPTASGERHSNCTVTHSPTRAAAALCRSTGGGPSLQRSLTALWRLSADLPAAARLSRLLRAGAGVAAADLRAGQGACRAVPSLTAL
jgi:hypothetical protein